MIYIISINIEDMKIYKLLSIIILLPFLLQASISNSCTVITTSSNLGNWFGYNEDRPIEDFDDSTKIRFYTHNENLYSHMEVTAEKNNLFSIRVGINEKGVAISGNGLPDTPLIDHPEKQYSWNSHSLYRLILQNCENISDAKQIIQNFNFGPSMAYQVHISDRYGNAIVVSPGLNKEIVITEKSDPYFVSTNVNRNDIENGVDDPRTNLAINTIINSENLTKSTLLSTLSNIHAENFEAITFYSVIFDLKNLIMYFYLMHDFSKEVKLNLTQELLLGDHYYELKDLFPNAESIIEHTKNNIILRENLIEIIPLIEIILILFVILHQMISIKSIFKNENVSKSKKTKFIQSLLIHISVIIFIDFNGKFILAILISNIFVNGKYLGISILETSLFVITWMLFIVLICFQAFRIIENKNKEKLSVK